MLLKVSSQPVHTQLDIGLYKVWVLGGFFVQTGPRFGLEVVRQEDHKMMPVEHKFLKLRDHKQGRRAIHCFDLMVESSDDYQIRVRHPEELRVIRANLLVQLIKGAIPQSELGILLERVLL